MSDFVRNVEINPDNVVKPWWPGDDRVDKYMKHVRAAINRHVDDKQAFTDIYNRAYEALYSAIIDMEKQENEFVFARRQAF